MLAIQLRGLHLRQRGARGKHFVDGVEDHIGVGGLDQDAHHAVGLRELLVVLAAEIRGVEHDPDGRGRRLGTQRAGQRVAVHERHQDIRDDEVGAHFARLGQGLAAVGLGEHAMTRVLQPGSERYAVGAVIVGDQYCCHRRGLPGPQP